MKYLSSNEIRRLWLDFFTKKGHLQIPSASLIPVNDPTLLWINSGVAALKQYFDGSKAPQNPRLTNVQKSIRTNDIENVGKTSRHHTFFEMLGNFSIGDYFRKEAIAFAIEILTSEQYFAMPIEKLYFTYHPSDLATYEEWQKHGVKKENLIALEGNYWEIGEGPSGPNTEVFFDRGPKFDPKGQGVELLKEDIDNDRYIEIWGIVFSQFNAEKGKKREEYKELPSKNIDTGAGLERIAAILQDKETNFETDLFMPIIEKVSTLASVKYEDNLAAYRVISDHIRAATFALSDGAMFSNEGRGYVLRRLVRRAMRYGRQIGIEGTFLYKLVDVVVKIYEDFYTNLVNSKEKVKQLIKGEEERFIKTLQNGEQLMRKIIATEGEITSETAFKLYDTYGFPLDITKEIALEEGVPFNFDDFEKLLEEQRERARKARQDIDSMHKQSEDLLKFEEKSNFNYDKMTLTSTVIALFKDGSKVDELTESGEVILKETPFYAESGGQISDIGVMENKSTLVNVNFVLKAPHGQHLHQVEVQYGTLKVGDKLTLKVDEKKRLLTMRNHSATHLLQSALIEVLGEGITQQGSAVTDEYLRFDFNYENKVSETDLQLIEEKVNEHIASSLKMTCTQMNLKEAVVKGAKAMFTEKYDNFVRVVGFGDVSLELCGGTHVSDTSEIGIFIILSEHSIAAGIRRIEATTSLNAYREIKKREQLAKRMQNALDVNTLSEANVALKTLQTRKSELEKEVERLSDFQANVEVKNLMKNFVKIKDVNFLFGILKDKSRAELIRLIDKLKVKHENGVVVLIGSENNQFPILAAVGPEAIKEGYSAGVIVKNVALFLGGSGGGQKAFAQGAGKDSSKLSNVEEYLKELLFNE